MCFLGETVRYSKLNRPEKPRLGEINGSDCSRLRITTVEISRISQTLSSFARICALFTALLSHEVCSAVLRIEYFSIGLAISFTRQYFFSRVPSSAASKRNMQLANCRQMCNGRGLLCLLIALRLILKLGTSCAVRCA